MLSEHLGTSTLTAGNTRHPMPIGLKEVVDTSTMVITYDDVAVDKVLFHLRCKESTRLLPVYGIIVESGWIVVVRLTILGSHIDDETSLVLDENSEWSDSDAEDHMMLAIATVVDQMDRRGYDLQSDSAFEKSEDAMARLVFRKLHHNERKARYQL